MSENNHVIIRLAILSTMFWIQSCGGGGDSSSSVPNSSSNTPTPPPVTIIDYAGNYFGDASVLGVDGFVTSFVIDPNNQLIGIIASEDVGSSVYYKGQATLQGTNTLNVEPTTSFVIDAINSDTILFGQSVTTGGFLRGEFNDNGSLVGEVGNSDGISGTFNVQRQNTEAIVDV